MILYYNIVQNVVWCVRVNRAPTRVDVRTVEKENDTICLFANNKQEKHEREHLFYTFIRIYITVVLLLIHVINDE